jgi:hypothetical protein
MLLARLKFAAALLLLFACSGTPTTPDTSQGAARRAINALVDNYESPRLERFFDLIDDSRFPNFDVFRENVRRFQLNNRQVILDVIIDGVDGPESDVGVRAHWNKSFVTQQGMHKLQAGQCEFLFRRQPSGGLLLTAIRNTSPF